jgi:hypothetical protein
VTKHNTAMSRGRLDQSRLEAFLARLRGDQTLTTSCALCEWSFAGSLDEARAAFAEHVCGRPTPSTSRWQRRRFAFRR